MMTANEAANAIAAAVPALNIGWECEITDDSCGDFPTVELRITQSSNGKQMGFIRICTDNDRDNPAIYAETSISNRRSTVYGMLDRVGIKDVR